MPKLPLEPSNGVGLGGAPRPVVKRGDVLSKFIADHIGVGELIYDEADLVVPEGQQAFYAQLDDTILVFTGTSEENIIRKLQNIVTSDRRLGDEGDPSNIANMM